jgi:hypothetical protein
VKHERRTFKAAAAETGDTGYGEKVVMEPTIDDAIKAVFHVAREQEVAPATPGAEAPSTQGKKRT